METGRVVMPGAWRLQLLEFHLDGEDLNNFTFPNDCANFQAVEFHSKSEAACAVLMQKYIKDWRLEVGHTYQIPLVQGRTADFKIGEAVIFEYHPISLHRDMISDNARRDLERNLKHCKQYLRDTIADAIKDELYYQYFSKRQILMKSTPGLEHGELIVAIDPKGFYRKIIQRFSDNPPRMQEFHREWNQILRITK